MPLSGEVEADETFVGGRVRASDHRPRSEVVSDKAVVFGAVERGGRVRADVAPTLGACTLHGAIRRFVLPTSGLDTSEHAGYVEIGREIESAHEAGASLMAVTQSGRADREPSPGWSGRFRDRWSAIGS